MTIMLSLLMSLSLIFLWLNHPISMGIIIMANTLIVSMTIGMMMESFWFSYIIMITMMSGMLVLFIYMASVASNEKFKLSVKLIISSTMMILIMMIIMQIKFDDMQMTEVKVLSPELMSLNIMFNCKFKYITMLMVMYLLFTMITVSYIVNVSEGPLRINKK
uniref:NADH dehydrogenase subunit 6 n=1 Tax=Dalader distanti TaxID=2813411 RepID=A0A8T9ZY35_9HEMI|nr:NADH dehydrogenase subunit 6 [Dalader distanti]